MKKIVGIPRGLFFYQYYPLWKTFFEELGAEIMVSDSTNRLILDDGVKSCVDEACLPVKLFHGHVINLKGKVDYILIPRFTSISKGEYVCPKFGGLPDMVKNTLEGLPKIIDTEVNLRKSKRNAMKAALETGSYFTDNRRQIKHAFEKALKSHREFRNQVKKGAIPCDVLNGLNKNNSNKIKDMKNGSRQSCTKLNIAVIGHIYNLNDSYISMNMIKKLEDNNINIITIETIDSSILNEKSEMLPKKMFWNFGKKALGAAFHLLERDDINGIIYLMSFGCGVDSFICDLVQKKVKQSKDIPFIILTIDEHSGEAGLDTRLEAFIDLIRWRVK